MASPLLISANLRTMSDFNIETYTNERVIKVNQDAMGIQGHRVVGQDLSSKNGTNVWTRPLSNGDRAIAFANVGPNAADVTCDVHCLSDAFVDRSRSSLVSDSDVLCALDLWDGTEEKIVVADGLIARKLPADGGIKLMRVSVCTEYRS